MEIPIEGDTNIEEDTNRRREAYITLIISD